MTSAARARSRRSPWRGRVAGLYLEQRGAQLRGALERAVGHEDGPCARPQSAEVRVRDPGCRRRAGRCAAAIGRETRSRSTRRSASAGLDLGRVVGRAKERAAPRALHRAGSRRARASRRWVSGRRVAAGGARRKSRREEPPRSPPESRRRGGSLRRASSRAASSSWGRSSRGRSSRATVVGRGRVRRRSCVLARGRRDVAVLEILVEHRGQQALALRRRAQ